MPDTKKDLPEIFATIGAKEEPDTMRPKTKLPPITGTFRPLTDERLTDLMNKKPDEE